ncbi:SAM-dependent methyltransferase [Streptomyces harbinensis]|uniref:Cyclopropane-fatty-acyl-phospholipid synthase n=1 Tax=Streptomyces harbinensis TaxID=1176198 RepID=A0A1I6PFM7_9ACTN|nr:cyclopropane-fatty-acyl-phospholipid synthase family protein [Streptomyces harbinensis]SFS39021.1 cyclopropane-fatty-acyl-phospholipid synthase [Streptomyces harbinensis]
MTDAATRLAPLLHRLFDGPPPLRVRAWDGSETGPAHAPTVVLRNRRALRRLLWQPGELGLAEAYITGDLDVAGDLGTALRTLWTAVREQRIEPPRPTAADRARLGRVFRIFAGPRRQLRHLAALSHLASTTRYERDPPPCDAPHLTPRPDPRRSERHGLVASLAGLGVLGPRPPAPAGAARLRGVRHSRARDRAAIAHHYDLSNAFYARLLDPSLAYSCGYWTADPDDPAYGVADAQRDKLALICRKLALRPGMRLLDVGCGWGALSLYAAAEHKAQVTAVTLSAEQARHVRAEAERRGLGEWVDVQLCHYRDIRGGWYEAVASIEMGEHVGDAEYPGFAQLLTRMLRPHGRLLLQQMSRGAHAPGGGPFIETYIAPDMHMRPVGGTVGLLEEAGLEVRSVESLREHYVRTVRAWLDRLESGWPDFTGLVGEETCRVWRLYLTGAALAFEQRRMGVDQILAVRPSDGGGSGMEPTPAAWYRGSVR